MVLNPNKYYLTVCVLAFALIQTAQSQVNFNEHDVSINYSLNNTWYPLTPALEINATLYGNLFLKGLKCDTLLSKSCTKCFNATQWLLYHEIPITLIKYHYSDFNDMIYNTTFLLSNISYDLQLWTNVSYDFYHFIESQVQQFGSLNGYMLAFLQHAVANVNFIQQLYQRLSADSTNSNYTDMAFVSGRLLNFIINVPPINRGKLQSKNELITINEQPQAILSVPQFQNGTTPTSPFTSAFLNMLNFDGVTNFLLAALNGTGKVNVSTLAQCKQSATTNWENQIQEVQANFSQNQIYEGFTALWQVLNNTDPVAHSCLSGFELMGSSFTQARQSNVTAVFNTFYNFPQIYNDLVSVALFVMRTPYSPTMTAEQAGNYVGLAIAEVLKNPKPYH